MSIDTKQDTTAFEGGPAPEPTADAGNALMQAQRDGVYRVLRTVRDREEMVEACGYPSDLEDASRQEAARVIAAINRGEGWLDHAGADADGLEVRARPIRDRPVPIRLDRAHLELAILADHLLRHSPSLARRGGMPGRVMTDRQREVAAVCAARSTLALDRDWALDLVASRLFRGTLEQRLWQLGWMLDGAEPGLVVCRHCYDTVDASDPYLIGDREDGQTMRRREDDGLARYSAHAACEAVAPAKDPGVPRPRRNGPEGYHEDAFEAPW